MSLKAIEMQIAIPRTQEAGRVQNQLQGRTTHEQFLLAAAQQKQAMRNLRRSESTTKSQLQAQQDHKRSHQKKSSHPYKGKTVDIQL